MVELEKHLFGGASKRSLYTNPATENNTNSLENSAEGDAEFLVVEDVTADTVHHTDLVTVLEIPFNGVTRSIAFVVFDSSDAVADTKALVSYVQRTYGAQK